MKHTLFARGKARALPVASALAFCLAVPAAPAAAQGIPVIDVASIAKSGLQHIQTIARWTSQLQQMQQQYTQMLRTANSLAHPTSVQGFAGDLARLSNTFPGGGEVGNLARGVGSFAGSASQMASITNGITTGSGFSAAEIERRARAVANLQSLAQQQVRTIEGRISGIRELLDKIDAQPDVQASAALGNRIQAEVAMLGAQQQQVAQLQVLQRAQEQADSLRQEERGRRSAEAWEARTEWAWGGE